MCVVVSCRHSPTVLLESRDTYAGALRQVIKDKDASAQFGEHLGRAEAAVCRA